MSCFTWHGTLERERKTIGGVKVVKLAGGGSVIKGATSSSFKMQTELKTLGKECTVVFIIYSTILQEVHYKIQILYYTSFNRDENVLENHY